MGKNSNRPKDRLSVINWTPFERIEVPTGMPTVDGCGGKDAKIYRNNLYVVIVYFMPESKFGPGFHLSIRRQDRSPIRDWREFQRIKNELVTEDAEAIELFPAEHRLIDTSNQSHIFCFPRFEFPFGWDHRLVSEVAVRGAVQRPFPPDRKPTDLKTREELEALEAAYMASHAVPVAAEPEPIPAEALTPPAKEETPCPPHPAS